MQERPEELPRHVLERELEVRVLERGVVAGLVGRLGDPVAPAPRSWPTPVLGVMIPLAE